MGFLMPNENQTEFPNIVVPSNEYCIRSGVKTTIEGETGMFFGCVSKSTGQPEGYGVFLINVIED